MLLSVSVSGVGTGVEDNDDDVILGVFEDDDVILETARVKLLERGVVKEEEDWKKELRQRLRRRNMYESSELEFEFELELE